MKKLVSLLLLLSAVQVKTAVPTVPTLQYLCANALEAHLNGCDIEGRENPFSIPKESTLKPPGLKEVKAVHVLPDGRIIVAGNELIGIYNPGDGTFQRLNRALCGDVNKIEISPNQEYMAVSAINHEGDIMLVINLKTGANIKVPLWPDASSNGYFAAFSGSYTDTKLAVSSDVNYMKVVTLSEDDFTKQSIMENRRQESCPAYNIAYTEDDELILVGGQCFTDYDDQLSFCMFIIRDSRTLDILRSLKSSVFPDNKGLKFNQQKLVIMEKKL